MAQRISKYDNLIDSRDVIERIETLEEDQEAAMGGFACVEDMDDETRAYFLEWEADNGHELDALRELAGECEGFPDWKYGLTLIRDSYFEDYAQDLAEDCGMLQKGATWPYTCIDWEQAARELQADYSMVTFDGVDYWVRS